MINLISWIRLVSVMAIVVNFVIGTNLLAYQVPDEVVPINLLQGCQVDLNRDYIDDLVIFYKNYTGFELVAFLRDAHGYRGHILYKGNGINLRIPCQYVDKIKETDAGRGNRIGPAHVINNFSVFLNQPESSSSMFYWDVDRFIQIWIRD